MTRRKVQMAKVNIFADLDLPDAENQLLKAEIVSEIYRLVKDRKLNQTEAGKVMAITQPEVSRLFKGHFRGYSIDRLVGFLTRLDREVEIIARPLKGRRRAGRVRFTSEAA